MELTAGAKAPSYRRQCSLWLAREGVPAGAPGQAPGPFGLLDCAVL
jgi:hypothetical protein